MGDFRSNTPQPQPQAQPATAGERRNGRAKPHRRPRRARPSAPQHQHHTQQHAPASSVDLPQAPLASLEGLPDDVLAHVFERLDETALVRLRGVSRTLDSRVLNLGIPLHLTQHPVLHRTLHPPASEWSPRSLLSLNGQISRALAKHTLHAVQVGPEWREDVIPSLCLRGDEEPALVLGVGTSILRHPLLPRRIHAPLAVGAAAAYALAPAGVRSGASDVVGIHALPGGGYVVAQFDGTLQRVQLEQGGIKSTAHYVHPRGRGPNSPGNIHSLAGHEEVVMSASTGSARVFNTRSPWVDPVTVDLGAGVRVWSAALSQSHAYLGLSGGISVYPLPTLPSSFSPPSLSKANPTPMRVLHGSKPGSSAPYAVIPSNTGSTILSAWYDATTRLHDLRLKQVAPVLELCDPWSDTAFYSAAWVGEHGVAAGGAQHGTVSVWDVRNPTGGWSVFSPAGRGSPVYSLAGDGGRVWGVTSRRAFVLAFDGSGGENEGIVVTEARAGRKVGNRKGGRGGKQRGWTKAEADHTPREVSMGYRHEQGMALFETEVPA